VSAERGTAGHLVSDRSAHAGVADSGVELEVQEDSVGAMNDSALEVIGRLDTEDKFEHLFVNRQTGKPYGTIMKVWSRLRSLAGLPHLRIHDLRHQFASFLVNSGRTLYEGAADPGPLGPSVTQRYAHLSSRSLQRGGQQCVVAIRAGSMPMAGHVDGGLVHAE